MAESAGQVAFGIAFQKSPIILTGGIAQLIPGQMLPIIAITEALNFAGLLSGASASLDALDGFAVDFTPMPGGTLINQQIAHYPFANQNVAANAVIAEPLTISLLMIYPARPSTGGYPAKLATMMALQAALSQHNQMGGLYTVATPAFFYTNLVMRMLVDVTPAGTKKPQELWRWDFEQPLVTLNQAQQALNNMMSQIAAGVPTSGALSGGTPGLSPLPGPTASVVPSASNLPGTAVAGTPQQVTGS